MKPRIIGITGGIGSGKSTVARIIEQEWCPVYCTDARAKAMQDTCPAAIEGMKKLFGSSIYLPGGALDRPRVAAMAFTNPATLKALNSLIHPLVKDDFMKFAQEHGSKQFVAIESAILISSGFHAMAEFCILVTASLEERISRVMARDGATRQQVMLRINSQMPDSETAKYCKYTIENSSMASLGPQIKKIFQQESRQ